MLEAMDICDNRSLRVKAVFSRAEFSRAEFDEPQTNDGLLCSFGYKLSTLVHELENLGLCASAEPVNQVIHLVSKFVQILNGGPFIGLSFRCERRRSNDPNTKLPT